MSQQFNKSLEANLHPLNCFARSLIKKARVMDADDLVQAACERALARQHQFQPDTNFKNWIFCIAKRIWLDELRAEKKEKLEPLETLPERFVSSGSSVEHLDARLQLAEVDQLLGELPEEQRTALLLVCLGDMEYKEAALICGIPVGTVMSRIARASGTLYAKLNPEMAEAFASRTDISKLNCTIATLKAAMAAAVAKHREHAE